MTLREDLVAAKALIDTPEKWLQGRYRSKRGNTACFCTMGALFEICGTGTARLTACREALNAALPPAWRTRTASLFNDSRGRGHDDIMSLFNNAIAAAP